MFDNLRDAFREAIANFKDELSRDQVPETVDRLLVGMRDEVADAKVRLKELDDLISRAELESAREKREAETARRRGKMAADIGDEETVKVASEYARKHEERQKLLEQKVVALRNERVHREEEIADMLAKLKEAKASRDALAAQAGRSEARESIGAADDLFSELDRMAEKIGDEDARARAAEDMDFLDLDDDDLRGPPREQVDVDERLEELKRRMGRE
jgi:phage shock protein A